MQKVFATGLACLLLLSGLIQLGSFHLIFSNFSLAVVGLFVVSASVHTVAWGSALVFLRPLFSLPVSGTTKVGVSRWYDAYLVSSCLLQGVLLGTAAFVAAWLSSNGSQWFTASLIMGGCLFIVAPCYLVCELVLSRLIKRHDMKLMGTGPALAFWLLVDFVLNISVVFSTLALFSGMAVHLLVVVSVWVKGRGGSGHSLRPDIVNRGLWGVLAGMIVCFLFLFLFLADSSDDSVVAEEPLSETIQQLPGYTAVAEAMQIRRFAAEGDELLVETEDLVFRVSRDRGSTWQTMDHPLSGKDIQRLAIVQGYWYLLSSDAHLAIRNPQGGWSLQSLAERLNTTHYTVKPANSRVEIKHIDSRGIVIIYRCHILMSDIDGQNWRTDIGPDADGCIEGVWLDAQGEPVWLSFVQLLEGEQKTKWDELHAKRSRWSPAIKPRAYWQLLQGKWQVFCTFENATERAYAKLIEQPHCRDLPETPDVSVRPDPWAWFWYDGKARPDWLSYPGRSNTSAQPPAVYVQDNTGQNKYYADVQNKRVWHADYSVLRYYQEPDFEWQYVQNRSDIDYSSVVSFNEQFYALENPACVIWKAADTSFKAWKPISEEAFDDTCVKRLGVIDDVLYAAAENGLYHYQEGRWQRLLTYKGSDFLTFSSPHFLYDADTYYDVFLRRDGQQWYAPEFDKDFYRNIVRIDCIQACYAVVEDRESLRLTLHRIHFLEREPVIEEVADLTAYYDNYILQDEQRKVMREEAESEYGATYAEQLLDAIGNAELMQSDTGEAWLYLRPAIVRFENSDLALQHRFPTHRTGVFLHRSQPFFVSHTGRIWSSAHKDVVRGVLEEDEYESTGLKPKFCISPQQDLMLISAESLLAASTDEGANWQMLEDVYGACYFSKQYLATDYTLFQRSATVAETPAK